MDIVIFKFWARPVWLFWIIRDAVGKYIQADTPLFAMEEAR